MKLKLLVAGLALCLASATTSAASFQDAEAAVMAAQKAGFPWTTTLNLLEKAKKAQENNDASSLKKFITEIIKQTDAAMYQAEQAKKIGPRF